MPETMSPREVVAQIIKDKVSGPHFTDPSHFVEMEQDRFAAADAILAALASSGDHAELARLTEAATPGPWFETEGHPSGRTYGIHAEAGPVVAFRGIAKPHGQGEHNAAFIAAANPATVLALLAENAALRAARDDASASCTAWSRTVGEMAVIGENWKERCVEAERKLAEAAGLLAEFKNQARVGYGGAPVTRSRRVNVPSALFHKICAWLSKEAERG